MGTVDVVENGMVMISVPVKVETPDAWFTETEGLLRLGEGRLVLEYETKDGLFGVYRSGVTELELLPDDVVSVSYRAGVFKGEIVIRARSMKTVADVPGAKHGQIRLRVRRKDRPRGAELVAFLEQRLGELQMPDHDDTLRQPLDH